MPTTDSFLSPRGGYRNLRSFQTASIIYDATVRFCDRFVEQGSRLRDQMIQAARSGRQNIAEGSRAAATSSKSELKLTNVARASLDELLLDFEDFLRQRGLAIWDKDHFQARQVRSLAWPDGTDTSRDMSAYAPWLENDDATVAANACICLIHQANYLLDRQIKQLQEQFLQNGGVSERMYAARTERRDGSTGKPPACPRCGKPMIKRQARQGRRAGSVFWGCSFFPKCRATLEWKGSSWSERLV